MKEILKLSHWILTLDYKKLMIELTTTYIAYKIESKIIHKELNYMLKN